MTPLYEKNYFLPRNIRKPNILPLDISKNQSKVSSNPLSPIVFNRQQVFYIIEKLVDRAKTSNQSVKNLSICQSQHLLESVYMQAIVRKILNEMGDQRRLGNNLRGLSKLIIEDIFNEAWPIAEMEINLFRKQKQRQQIISKLQTVFNTSKNLD